MVLKGLTGNLQLIEEESTAFLEALIGQCSYKFLQVAKVIKPILGHIKLILPEFVC